MARASDIAPPATDTTPPSLLLLALEGRALWEMASLPLARPFLDQGPEGDGHPVMVLPGFLATGFSTRPLRRFLRRRGWHAHCWKMGRNLGLDPRLEEAMLERVEEVHRRHGRKVSLVGWSLGGVYSRWIANHVPGLIRTVITLGSPFQDNPRANHSWRLFEQLSGRSIDEIDDETYRRIRDNPPVPTTAVYSRGDGITAWECCVQEEDELSENVEVAGSHCGLGVNPLVLHVIADRLAQPEGAWEPFRRDGLRRLFYRRPAASELPLNGNSAGNL